MSEHCVRCGSAVEPLDRFCRKCGSQLSTEGSACPTAPPPSGSDNRRTVAVLFAAACVSVAVVAAAAFALSRDGSRDAPPVANQISTQPAPETSELSGTWEGTYSYENARSAPVRFTFAASFDASRISGTIMEPHTIDNLTPPTQTATVEGQLTGSAVRFSKRYANGDTVEYEGTLAPAGGTIRGRWRTADPNVHGTYEMRRRTPELRIVAAAAPAPAPAAAVAPAVVQTDDNAQLATAIRSHMLNMRRIVFDTDSSGCARATRGTLTCGSIRMRTVPCSEILAVERVEVTDIGRDAAFGVVPVEAVVWIRVTDLERFQGQQRAGVIKCVSARGANWSTTRATPVRFRFDAERWRSGWRIAGG